MAKDKEKYENLKETFEKEEEDIEKKVKRALEKTEAMPEYAKRNRAVIMSVSLLENDRNFISYLRSQITDPENRFYPTNSHIVRAGLEYLKTAEKEEIRKVIRKFIT